MGSSMLSADWIVNGVTINWGKYSWNHFYWNQNIFGIAFQAGKAYLNSGDKGVVESVSDFLYLPSGKV